MSSAAQLVVPENAAEFPAASVMPSAANNAAFSPAITATETASIVESITAIDRAAWNACFADEIENYEYLFAVEQSHIGGFQRRYAVVEEAGKLLAAMPVFFMAYELDTTFKSEMLRNIARRIRSIFPRFLVLKLACFGGAEIERGVVGFHPDVAAERQVALLAKLVQAVENTAIKSGYKLIAAKDIPDSQAALWQAATPQYTGFSGMPTAVLPIDFTTMDGYLAKLSKETRKDMRRKLKVADAIRIEQRTDISDVVLAIYALYQSTRNRSEFQFEELTEAYFKNLLTMMPGRAFCTVYYHGEELLAANFLLQNEQTLLDKFFCMDARGRAFNLYFLSWFTNLNHCLAHGLRYYQSGQAGYENKRRLGSALEKNGMRFRHTHPLMNRLLQWIVPLVAMGEDDAE